MRTRAKSRNDRAYDDITTNVDFLPRDASRARYCHGKLSVRSSVCDAEASWSHRLEYFENNFTADQPGVFALCKPQHQGSAPKGTPPNFSHNMGEVLQKWLLADKTRNISETVEDRANVRPTTNCLYKVTHELSIGAKMCDLE